MASGINWEHTRLSKNLTNLFWYVLYYNVKELIYLCYKETKNVSNSQAWIVGMTNNFFFYDVCKYDPEI